MALTLFIFPLTACSNEGNIAGQSGQASAALAGLDETAEEQIREAISRAPAHGLKATLFLKGGESGEELAQAALKYASALADGYTDPGKLFEVYTIARPKVNVEAGLAQAMKSGKIAEWLDSLPPQTDEYKALSKAFLAAVSRMESSGQRSIAEGKAIKPGDRDARVPVIAAALQSAGYLNGQVEGQSALYVPQLVAAVRQFQSDSGMKADGIVGPKTIEALNTGPAERVRKLAVAMERLRWLPRNPPKTRIDVNTAASDLGYWRDGQLVDRRKVVTGEADKPTPQLQSPLYRLVAKPTWTVPKGIGEKELATKSRAWLNDNNFTFKNGHYVQDSGPENSLGLVKFDMQNEHAIYLHDTPAKALFAQDDRHRSHGCVRVENALQFATALAQQQGVLPEFRQAMQQDDETFVKLPAEIPVRLLYRTAFWDGARIQFRDDVYGWDANIARALELAPGPARKIVQPESSDDIGP